MSPESIDQILQLLKPIDPLRSLPEGTAILVKAAEIKGEKAIQYQGKLYPAVLPENVKLGEMIKVVLQAKSDILLLKLLDRPEALKAPEQQILRALVTELRRNEVQSSTTYQEKHVQNSKPLAKNPEQPDFGYSTSKQEFVPEQLIKKVSEIENNKAQDFIAKKDLLRVTDRKIIDIKTEQKVSEIERKIIESLTESKVVKLDKKTIEEVKKATEILIDKINNTKSEQLINLVAPLLRSPQLIELEPQIISNIETILKTALEQKVTEKPKIEQARPEQVTPEQLKLVEENKDEIVRIIESVLKIVKKVDHETQVFKALEAMIFKPIEQLEKSSEKVLELIFNSNEVLERVQEKRSDAYAVFPFFYGSIGRVVIGELLVKKNKKRRFRLFLEGFGELVVDIDDDKINLTVSSKETYLLLKENIHIVKSEFPGLEVLISLGHSGLLLPEFVQEKLSLARRA